jgi:aspartyl-tRNA(Asn)/glutamyl-tRNA(Gln) amidotransferase subunit C
MSLTIEDVRKVAHLARLQLGEAEIEAYQEQLSSVLAYVAQLDELDLEGVAPTAHAVARTNVLRDDVVKPSLSQEEVLFNAPQQAEGQFLVQAVLDEA